MADRPSVWEMFVYMDSTSAVTRRAPGGIVRFLIIRAKS